MVRKDEKYLGSSGYLGQDESWDSQGRGSSIGMNPDIADNWIKYFILVNEYCA